MVKALKRDVTRLGRRTNQGAIDDGVNSAMRYFINNYQDPSRQRGIDRLLGLVEGDGVRKAVRRLPEIAQLLDDEEEEDDEDADESDDGEGEVWGERDEDDSDDDESDDEKGGAGAVSTADGVSAALGSGNEDDDNDDDDELAAAARQCGARLDRVFADITKEQQALFHAARGEGTAAGSGPGDAADKARAAGARRATTVTATSSPLRAALRILVKSRLALLAVLLLVMFRLHASLLSGGIR